MEFKWPKRSHRDVDTYFAGYEKQEHIDPATGRKRTEYVYHGGYYIFSVSDDAFTSFRRMSALRAAAATALFAAAHLLGPRGSILPYIGIPALLSIIPLVYMWMGLIVLLRTKTPRMTIREYCFGLERMENVLWILLALWAIASLGELIFMVLKRIFTPGEIAAALLQCAALAAMLIQQKRQSALLASCVNKPETGKMEG